MFGQTQVEYLGHIIFVERVKVDHSKISKMKKWPKPRSLKALRGLLGLTGYYRKFVKDYGKIAAPLTQLLKKDSFLWDEKVQKAFEDLKLAMTTLLVLTILDFKLPFNIEADASAKGIGAILMQK